VGKSRSIPAFDENAELHHGLSREEDDELRRLHQFSELGDLAGRKLERLIELRLRDRRKEIRPLQQFGATGPTASAKKRRWLGFLGR
jgi:hypothetical protein